MSANECYNYGSMSGCDIGCPVLLRGDCTIVEEVVESLSDSDLNELAESDRYTEITNKECAKRGLTLER